jgi:dolichol-phosphate mannosyltransferase
MHRFIPIYASWQGARVIELPVRHHARQFGASKYGLERVVKVLLDLLVIVFFDRYFSKPIYVFGTIALALLGGSILTFIWMLSLRIFADKSFVETPLPVITAVLGSVGIISFLIGLLAEVLMRTYFESQGLKPYLISERINFDGVS